MADKRKYFGTDGIRGKVGEFPIKPDFVLKLGWAMGHVLAKEVTGGKVLIGKDTRISGYMFESALEAGLVAAGIDIELAGPMPTPAIAYLTRTLRARLGIVISASHNPYFDNGIKLFSREGFKLPDEVELAIESALDKEMTMVKSDSLGKANRVADAVGRYIEFCKSTIKNEVNLKGLKIVVDCANGATYHIAPAVFRELGAEVVELAVNPDGFNINAGCGATDLKMLTRIVLAEEADLGIAFDGDGDRVMMVDHKGEIVDGDELLFIITRQCHQRHPVIGVVGTAMSNLGLEIALKSMGIKFVRAQIGDRYVMMELKQLGWLLGGEGSGHIINLDKTTTGDGIVSALQVVQALFYNNKTLHELKLGMHKFPQVLINVPVKRKIDLFQEPKVKFALTSVEERLSGTGRVLLRASGTEPLIRIMVEGEDAMIIQAAAEELAEIVTKVSE
ncbi:MAG: phosphoglucosamine mutase [Gammaproteobacteria bacterium RIFCSPHIGHO2_12_FULL_35_23]|nr:MAG: phosphoglucosamine mutase [Gammaproteobacteria bacterium RIFCSPHIGHO2_12_FULL_35_23]